MYDLTGFQRDRSSAIAGPGAPDGSTVGGGLDGYYDADVDHGRPSPDLDAGGPAASAGSEARTRPVRSS